MALSSVREAVGPYQMIPLEWNFAAADAAGTMADRGHSQSTVLTYESLWSGFVAGYSVDAVGGNLADADYLIHVAGSPVAASAFTVVDAAVQTGSFLPSAVPFAAGDALALELDDKTTGRVTIVTLYLVVNCGA